MLYLTCTTISSVDLAQCGISFAKDWVSVKCGTIEFVNYIDPDEAPLSELPHVDLHSLLSSFEFSK